MSSGSRWVTMVLFDQLLMLYKIHQSPQTTDPAGSHLNRLFKVLQDVTFVFFMWFCLLILALYEGWLNFSFPEFRCSLILLKITGSVASFRDNPYGRVGCISLKWMPGIDNKTWLNNWPSSLTDSSSSYTTPMNVPRSWQVTFTHVTSLSLLILWDVVSLTFLRKRFPALINQPL